MNTDTAQPPTKAHKPKRPYFKCKVFTGVSIGRSYHTPAPRRKCRRRDQRTTKSNNRTRTRRAVHSPSSAAQGGGMSGAGGERPLIRPNSANSGGRRGARENYGGLPPPGHSQRVQGGLRAIRRFGFAPPHFGGRARQPDGKKPNRTAAHNSHSAPSSRGAASPPPASAWSGYLTGRPARPQSGVAGEGGAGDIMALCRRYHLRRGAGESPECPGKGAARPAPPFT